MNDSRWRYAEWLIITFNTRDNDRTSHDFIIFLKNHGIRINVKYYSKILQSQLKVDKMLPLMHITLIMREAICIS